MSIRPSEFHGTTDYHDEAVAKGLFCWRWMERNGTRYRVLTIEDGGDFADWNPKWRPQAMHGVNDFEEGLDGTAFCWRWFTLPDGNKSRVVTIEGSGHEFARNEDLLRPEYLAGTNGYSDHASEYNFCWRWFDRDGTKFRVVTLE